MDLIFMNASREDIGVLQDYELDLAFGADENNFECRIQAQAHCCEAGFFLYAEGTEYGGVIDSITSDTAKKEIIYSGRTWQGILNSKIIEPYEGADYLIVSGDANEVLGSLVARLALSDMFEGSTESSGIDVSNYRMHRYVSGYDGIRKMLESVGGKLNFAFKNGKIVLAALPIHDYSQDEEFDADLVSFKAVRNYKAINHLICLGSGELADRLVVHLYADTDGTISQTQTQFGMDEVSAIYEYSNISDRTELIKEGTEQFKGMLSADEISIDFDSNDDKYDVGDIIGAYDPITHLFATAPIVKKIVTIKDGRITISLTPDEAKGGIAMEIGGAVISGGGGGGTNIDLPVSIENGGTGATTAEEARSNLGAAADFVTIADSGENLDNYTTAGWYYFRNSPTNIPGGSNGWLHVMTAPTLAIVKQVFYRYGTPSSNDYQTWVRTKNTASNGGTWGKWWRYAVIDEAVFTTREVTLTIADQTSYEMTTIAAYSRSGIVDVHINTRPTTVSSSWLTVATLPSGYRPPVNIYKVESYYNASSNYANLRLRITTAGLVQLCLGTASANYAFNATFVMA